MKRKFSAQLLVPGVGRGAALILREPLSLWGGLDPETGVIIDQRHPNVGQSVTQKVLLMPGSRGSSSASSILLEAVRAGTAPAAIITLERDAIVALGAAVARALYGSSPPVARLDTCAYAEIRAGDRVVVTCTEEDSYVEVGLGCNSRR